MAKQGENNIKLGIFVLAGLLTLIFALYLIGKNRNLFGSNFELKARFSNLNGLIEGSNVLFSGIQAGTVKKIDIKNDSVIEVTLSIENKIKPFIHKNAIASIGTEGLMGDKIINILPVNGKSDLVDNGDLIAARKLITTDDMLQTLSKTNNNIADISEGLKNTVSQINNSAIWTLLNDHKLSEDFKSTLNNIRTASKNANVLTRDLQTIITQTKNGKGAAGALLTDTTVSADLKQAMLNIKAASQNANDLTLKLNSLVKDMNAEMNSKKGVLNVLLKDSVTAKNLKQSMENVRKGTDGFNQNMEALKHNFLLRGYFKNLEKKKQRDSLMKK
jgi:phospholipid/cholesterol/gamma-HCH transport system substrate-binding protein